jgi:chromosome segregation ATPase
MIYAAAVLLIVIATVAVRVAWRRIGRMQRDLEACRQAKAGWIEERNNLLDSKQTAEDAGDRALRDVGRLEHDIAALGHKYEATRQEAEVWKASAAKWEAKFDEADAARVKAVETVADWVAQRTFGRKIFNHAPALPSESHQPRPIPKTRVQARLVVQQAERQFENEIADAERRRVNPRPTQQPAAVNE